MSGNLEPLELMVISLMRSQSGMLQVFPPIIFSYSNVGVEQDEKMTVQVIVLENEVFQVVQLLSWKSLEENGLRVGDRDRVRERLWERWS